MTCSAPSISALTISLLAGAASAFAQSGPDLAGYFGFEDPRVLVVDNNTGPARAVDMNGDGLTDLVVVNNRKSRLEIHVQRREARSFAERERGFSANELPPSEWYDRTDVPLAHRVNAFEVHDVDGDGLLDIVYAGQPSEIVTMRQTEPMTFDVANRCAPDRRCAGR